MTGKALPRSVAVIGATLVLFAAIPTAALAHAGFITSSPEPGATLGTAPGQVTLTFSEPLNEELSRATVATPEGVSVDGTVAPGDRIVIDLTTGQTGVYEVTWTTVSVVDGHTLSGAFRFGVGVSPGAGAEGGTIDEPARGDLIVVVGRIVEDAGLLLVVGLLLFGRLARRNPFLGWVRTPTLAAFAAAFAGGISVVVGEALLAASQPSGSSILAYLTTAQPGWWRLTRVVLEAVGIVAAWRWRRAQAPIVVAAVISLAAAGHAAAVDPRAWGMTVEAIHLLSAGLWAGGLLALAFQRPPGGWLGDAGRSLLDRFTPVALAAFAVTVVTGALRGAQEVGGWEQLFGSTYGVVLLVKIVLVFLVVQLSIFAWRRIAVVPRWEASVTIAVIAAAGLLSAFPLPPARQAGSGTEGATGEPSPPAAEEGALTLGSHAGSVLVGVTIAPATPGTNALTVYVQSLDGPEATAALPLEVSVDGGPVRLEQCADTCREGSVELSGGERLSIHVGSPTGGTATFDLPTLPVPGGDGLLEQMLRSMEGLSSYRLDEVLTSGLGTSVRATYSFVAPSSFESHSSQDGSSFSTVWIGETRYIRREGDPWEVQEGGPSPSVPTYIWDSFEPYRDARILGTTAIGGVDTTLLAFAGGDEELPAWFRMWIDEQGRVRRAEMMAPGHFMDHRYYDLDAPLTIAPPRGAT